MININEYMSSLSVLLQEKFGSRLVYIGLQGSYLRGEANENSDIDIMVVIDNLSVKDLERYRSILFSLPFFDKSCGFICGRDDLVNWNPLEISHLLHTTKDYFGTLSELVPSYGKDDIRNFVKTSVNNLYHAVCHYYIHAQNNQDIEFLSAMYKGVFFILQNSCFLKTGKFILTKNELLSHLSGNDRAVLKQSMELSTKNAYDFSESFTLLFLWCQEKIQEI